MLIAFAIKFMLETLVDVHRPFVIIAKRCMKYLHAES